MDKHRENPYAQINNIVEERISCSVLAFWHFLEALAAFILLKNSACGYTDQFAPAIGLRARVTLEFMVYPCAVVK